MNKRLAITLTVIFSALVSGMCTTWTISNSGFAFTPDTLRIVVGDDVDFSLESIHSAVEVSQDTWNANGNTALDGGFSVPLGGGSVSPDLLTVGTHWYVCYPHANIGMKGVIIVEDVTAVTVSEPEMNISFYPNPVYDIVTVKTGSDLLGSHYSFIDLAGKQILSGKLDEEIVTIDISNFESGIYLLQVGEQRKRTMKVVKK